MEKTIKRGRMMNSNIHRVEVQKDEVLKELGQCSPESTNLRINILAILHGTFTYIFQVTIY